ncbi:peptidoglycan -binding protein [Aestuariibius insulae]|uniref:peptidoglycan -binding protein n=1 Tax=Aestuariibius insulae TaxID=2058287 RepID=UPI00345EB881
MALSRRSGARFQASIWPGFVDAMTGLLLVLMFVLTIFMIVQFILRETITGQATELDELSGEVEQLADALGLERQRASNLQNETIQQNALIATLSAERDRQAADLANARTRIATFEEQVAGLLADRDAARETITTLRGEQETLLSEIDAQEEAARLAAARRAALDAMVADLQAQQEQDQAALSDAATQIDTLEAERLADAAAAQALRDRLEDADAELTAMTLALEERRREAEETLTLLAAARAELENLAEQGLTLDDLRDQLAAARAARTEAEETAATTLTEAERQAALLDQARAALSEEQSLSEESQRQVELLNQQVAELRNQLSSLQALVNLSSDEDAAAQIQIETLGSELNQALARAAAAERQRAESERRRAELEAAERARLAAEAENLERYQSEFFALLRDRLEGREGIRVEGDRFVFSSEVLFSRGSATLSSDGRAQIARVAAILRDISADIPDAIDWVIRVDGHTDDIPVSRGGRFDNNWELSQARALSVVLYMTEALGIPPQRLAANGFGEFQPLDPADTEAARARNRRIELKLTER